MNKKWICYLSSAMQNVIENSHESPKPRLPVNLTYNRLNLQFQIY